MKCSAAAEVDNVYWTITWEVANFIHIVPATTTRPSSLVLELIVTPAVRVLQTAKEWQSHTLELP